MGNLTHVDCFVNILFVYFCIGFMTKKLSQEAFFEASAFLEAFLESYLSINDNDNLYFYLFDNLWTFFFV